MWSSYRSNFKGRAIERWRDGDEMCTISGPRSAWSFDSPLVESQIAFCIFVCVIGSVKVLLWLWDGISLSFLVSSVCQTDAVVSVIFSLFFSFCSASFSFFRIVTTSSVSIITINMNFLRLAKYVHINSHYCTGYRIRIEFDIFAQNTLKLTFCWRWSTVNYCITSTSTSVWHWNAKREDNFVPNILFVEFTLSRTYGTDVGYMKASKRQHELISILIVMRCDAFGTNSNW